MATELDSVKKAFGGTKQINCESLQKLLRELSPDLQADELNSLLDAVGVNGSGDVHVDGFLEWLFTESTTVFFCRHGETDWNLDHKLQGHTDIPLNSAGHQQAQNIADALRPKRLAAVWSSPLMRAKDTANAIAQAAGVELKVDERLKERNLGVMEGRTGKEVEAEHPAVWQAWKALAEMPPESQCEPAPSVISRVESALFDLATAHPAQSVAVVAHGGVLRCLCKQMFSNASISTLSVGPQRSWKVVQLDDTGHLKTPGLKV